MEQLALVKVKVMSTTEMLLALLRPSPLVIAFSVLLVEAVLVAAIPKMLELYVASFLSSTMFYEVEVKGAKSFTIRNYS